MALSEQDREWVRAVVKEAVTEVLGKTKEYVWDVVKTHRKECAASSSSTWRLTELVFKWSLIIGIAVGILTAVFLGIDGITALIK